MVSERYSEEYDHLYAVGLNPCWGGRWSQSSWIDCDQAQTNYDVLILVVVEDGLRDRFKYSKCKDDLVFILVVVEDGLREYDHLYAVVMLDTVLILVVVEDGLRVLRS